jgi:hypothetical protein
MAGSSVIGALRVVLGADTAALDKGLKQSQAGLSVFGTAVAAGMAAVAASVAAAAIQITGSVKSVIDNADKMNKISQSTGLTVEALSKLSYAAELADISGETLGKSMGKLSKAITAAANDGASPAGQAFQQMGVAVRNQDGTMRSSADVLSDIAGKFETYRDGAAKTALAIALFGKAGAAMIPLLNQGAAGLKENADEAQRYGLVLDTKTTMAAEAFNDNLKRMDKIKQGVVTTMTAKMLPAFVALSSALLKSREESTLWNTVGDALAGVMNKIVAAGIGLITTWQRIFATAADVRSALKLLATGDFTGAWEVMTKSAAETASAVSALGSTVRSLVAPNNLDKFWSNELVLIGSVHKEVAALSETWKKDAPNPKIIDPENQKALDNYIASVYKRTAAEQADAQTVGQSSAAQAYLKTVYEAQAIALAKNIPLTAALNMQIAAAGQAAAQASMDLQAANIAQQVMSPAERYAQDLANLKTVYENTSMTAETFAARQQQLAEGIGATWQQVGSQVMGSFSQLASAFAKNNKTMGVAAKAFGIAQAIINTQLAVTKALATYGPTPMGYLAVAGAVAQGAASVATITAQGFASGGLVNGPGTSVSDSIPAMLSNGEFVMNAEATRRNLPDLQAMNSGQGGEVARRVSVPLTGNFFNRETITEWIGQVNAAIRDGVVLEVKPA